MVVRSRTLLNHIALESLRSISATVPFVTVVTDLVTFHPTWIDPKVTRCLVPTAAAREQAIALGMAPAKIAVYGQPVSLKFAQRVADKATLRHQLGFDLDRPTVLLLGGGEGSGQLRAIACAIAQKVPFAQMAVVTGRNQALYTRLKTLRLANPDHLYGFVDNMPELMHAADLVVTKARPNKWRATAGRPMILL
ncbi:MAG: glycosyltransferase [Caldilineaceae bacterium]